jgi:hypothetical protein
MDRHIHSRKHAHTHTLRSQTTSTWKIDRLLMDSVGRLHTERVLQGSWVHTHILTGCSLGDPL